MGHLVDGALLAVGAASCPLDPGPRPAGLAARLGSTDFFGRCAPGWAPFLRSQTFAEAASTGVDRTPWCRLPGERRPGTGCDGAGWH
jgi:hypothetical protein